MNTGKEIWFAGFCASNDRKEIISEGERKAKERPEVIKFLLGEGKLDGLWFGELYRESPFWWRKTLREYVEFSEVSTHKEEWIRAYKIISPDISDVMAERAYLSSQR